MSRLQRLCAASGVPDDLVPKICEFKSNWDTWNMAERENVEQLDLMTLRTECGELLTLHGAGRMDFAALAAACAELAKKYSRVPAVEQLTAELVMGHVFAIAAETGDW